MDTKTRRSVAKQLLQAAAKLEASSFEGRNGLVRVKPFVGGVALTFTKHITLSPRFTAKDIESHIRTFGEQGLLKLMTGLSRFHPDFENLVAKVDGFAGNDNDGVYFGAETKVRLPEDVDAQKVNAALEAISDRFGVKVEFWG